MFKHVGLQHCLHYTTIRQQQLSFLCIHITKSLFIGEQVNMILQGSCKSPLAYTSAQVLLVEQLMYIISTTIKPDKDLQGPKALSFGVRFIFFRNFPLDIPVTMSMPAMITMSLFFCANVYCTFALIARSTIYPLWTSQLEYIQLNWDLHIQRDR